MPRCSGRFFNCLSTFLILKHVFAGGNVLDCKEFNNYFGAERVEPEEFSVCSDAVVTECGVKGFLNLLIVVNPCCVITLERQRNRCFV
jgi:hypothetical protein